MGDTSVASVWSLWSEDFQILCVLWIRIHGRTHGYKWSLLKVREGKYKRECGGHRGNLEAESLRFSFLVLLKLTLSYQKGEPGDFYPIINEWEGAWVVPRPGEGGPWARPWSIWDVILFWIPNFPNFNLPQILPDRQDPEKIILRLLRGWSSLFSSESASGWQGTTDPTYNGNCLSCFFLWGPFGHKVSKYLSSTIKVPNGDRGCWWNLVCLQRLMDLLPHDLFLKAFILEEINLV
jgi:hypothetical protein